MENMGQLTHTLGTPSEAGLAAQMAFAFQFTLVLFFVISPMMGYFIAQGVKNRTNFFIGWGIGVLIMLLGSFGLSFLLRAAIPVDAMSDMVVGILSCVAAVAAGILLAKYIVWAMADPGKPAWVVAHENLKDEDLLPFERRRKREEARRNRARRK